MDASYFYVLAKKIQHHDSNNDNNDVYIYIHIYIYIYICAYTSTHTYTHITCNTVINESDKNLQILCGTLSTAAPICPGVQFATEHSGASECYQGMNRSRVLGSCYPEKNKPTNL